MKIRNILISFVIIMIVGVGASTVSAQEKWVKLGEKDVDFTIDHDTIVAQNKGSIREIHMRVAFAPIKFQRVVINYKDGAKQEVEYLEELGMDTDSRSITIEGDGHVIKSVDFWYETNTVGGKKAKLTVYGRS